MASQMLLQLLGSATSHPFANSANLLCTIVSVWRTLGARASIISGDLKSEYFSKLSAGRQVACGLMSDITKIAVE